MTRRERNSAELDVFRQWCRKVRQAWQLGCMCSCCRVLDLLERGVLDHEEAQRSLRMYFETGKPHEEHLPEGRDPEQIDFIDVVVIDFVIGPPATPEPAGEKDRQAPDA